MDMIAGNLFDTLSGLAPLLRVRPELHSLCRFGAHWKCDHEAESGASAPFHIVTNGTCVIELVGLGRSIQVSAGDVVVLPRGARHIVRGPTLIPGAAPPFSLEARRDNDTMMNSNTASQPQTELVCGRLNFEQAHQNLVLSALPDVIVITTSDGPDAARMRRLIAAIKDEIESARAGVSAIATDLASALFVMVVRVHLERERAGNGLLGLLAHRQAGRAVVAMLEDLSRPWTLDALAARASASRASLVRMFQKLAHMPPLEFLSELRLELARRKLATSSLPLGEIAAEIGYQSESAFSRAFRRRFGFPPGEARTSAAELSNRAPVSTHRANRIIPRPRLGGHRTGDTPFRGMVSFGT
ncbi:MAG: AraC family transcriptional regulator, activator of mtrCDE [Betaproteobacteria bacterium]|jgi:AraC family transcriptional activator of mtrCDE|nr:AraC family transcriptional regulator, activator of mtrCDE [Betaproteobacteria bacterium]